MNSRRLLASGFRCLLAAALLAGGGLHSVSAERKSFHFQRFCSLGAGDRFEIIALTGYAAGRSIGSGRIQKIGPKELRLEFIVRTLASGEIRGHLDLKHLGPRDRYKERFRLSYSADTPGGPEQNVETVTADAFLIRNGILALHPSGGEHFFQLSIDSRGRNKFVTHWGASRLAPKP